MAILGFDEPPWVTILRTAGPEIAAAVMAQIPTVRDLVIEPDLEHRRVVAIGTTRHHDHYGAVYAVTEALASLWTGFADHTVDLRVHLDALQVDVPAQFFTDPGEGLRRRRWATLTRSQLVHIHDSRT